MIYFPESRCGSGRSPRSDGVIPLRADGVAFDAQGIHLSVGDFLARGVLATLQHRPHCQAAAGGCAADEGQQGVPGPKRHAGPVAADLAKQSVLDRIPFAASSWVVADRHGESEPIANLHLETLFPSTDTAAITATGVCQHQEVVARPGGVAVALPPRCDGIHGERWRIARGAKIDEATIGRDVVYAIRHGPTVCVAGKVVHVDGDRLERPGLAGVLEVAHELLFLGVCTDDRQPSRGEPSALHSNVVELLVTVGVGRRGLDLLGIDVQRVVKLAQQTAHSGWTDHVARRFQLDAQRAQAAADPLLRGHRIAGRFGGYQLLEHRQDHRRFFSTDGRPAPGWRTRSAGWFNSEAANCSRPRCMAFSSTPGLSKRSRWESPTTRCGSGARYQRGWLPCSRVRNSLI